MFHCTTLIQIVSIPKVLFNYWLLQFNNLIETDSFIFFEAQINLNRTKYLKTKDLSILFNMA
jgi:hypothetical protein